MKNKILVAGIGSVSGIWLFLLAISCSDGEKEGAYLFRVVESSHSHIYFRNVIPENELTNSFVYEYVYNGAGVATGDLNGDGLPDMYFSSNLHENALYLNEGDLQFRYISKEAGVAGNRGWTTGVSMIDINQDGLLDIYVCKSGPFENRELLQNELYINQGTNEDGIPIFQESASKYGLDDASYSIQAAFLDFDLDGDLDMYLMNHNPQTVAFGKTEELSPLGDKFYVNEGGRYVEKSAAVGIYSNAISYGLGLGIGDLNLDGWPDMYISNDYDEPDYLYINNQDGTFQEVAKQATKHLSNFAMGNDIADFDNDGYLDILTLDMVAEDNYGMKTSMASMNPDKFARNVANGKHYQYMYNTLQKHSTYIDSAGIPFYSEIGQLAGISNTDWSWAPLIADFDNDGLKDIFITNGIKRDFRNKDFFHDMQAFRRSNPDALTNAEKINSLIERTPHRAYRNYFYRNNGGLRFENTSLSWINKPEEGYSNGAAYADFDLDGDLDLVMNNVDQEATLLENTSDRHAQHYLRIELQGPEGNRQGIGAKIEVYTQAGLQIFENYQVRGYQSSVQPGVHIGLGKQTVIDSLRIIWPGKQVQLVEDLTVDRRLTIAYQKQDIPSYEDMQADQPFFVPIAIQERMVHTENDYDDYQNQILLPHKMSQFGPAIAVGDVNGDGREDLYLGQSTGSVSRLYVQDIDGSFREVQAFDRERAYEDVDAAFLDIDQDGDMDLYVASGGNEFEAGDAHYQDRIYENVNGSLYHRPELLPDIVPISSSRIRIADYDKDGFPDLFVGGRHMPHQYPSPASSYLLHNHQGVFEEVSSTIAPDLKEIGLVTDASWSDFDADGDEDLCIVGEWMAPVLVENVDGTFRKLESASLEALTGWYFSVASSDVDGDGDLDFLLGNLGENYKYKASPEDPFEVYYHDFDDNGSKDLVLGYHNFGDLFPVRGKECSSQQMPKIKKMISSYDEFARSTVADIYGQEQLNEALHLSAYSFKSGILRNEGQGQFEFIAFPELAQLSSINAILSKDVDGDQEDELILAGNLFTSEIETPRNDAGYGLLLRHTDSSHFSPINPSESGLFLPGDIKVLRMMELDGSTVLVAGANDGPISFFRLHMQAESERPLLVE
ncbi:MAG: VCBS repeat-containing protein [Bacteroidota bacterium]